MQRVRIKAVMNWLSKIEGKRIQFRLQKEHVEIFQQLSSPSFFDSSLEKYFIYEPVNECQGFEIHLCCLR